MEVAADGVLVDRALGAVLAVVAAADPDPAHRPLRRRRGGSARCGSRTRPARPTGSSTTTLPMKRSGPATRDDVEEADARQRLGVVRPVLVAEQLVAAADGEQRRAALDRRLDRLALRALQVAARRRSAPDPGRRRRRRRRPPSGIGSPIPISTTAASIPRHARPLLRARSRCPGRRRCSSSLP